MVSALLALSALAYLWDLSASGYANSFYAAAVQAATKSWKAFFFGSLDASNFITVDKPAPFLWPMDLAARIFGFSSWSMLVPDALMGVATVGLVYAAVRRWAGAGAGMVAGTAMAATPVAALMFRFNNPDAMLVMLMAAGAYCVTRALERAGSRWLVAAGAMVGLAFLAKMGEALLVVPGFALAYAICGPTSLGRRLGRLLAASGAMVVSAGWWVLAVALWPVKDRPMIDGSTTNSIWNLIVSYNGLGRLEGSGGGLGGSGGNFSGAVGVFRLFNSLMGGQASWLLPAAGIALVTGLVATARAGRADRTRAGYVLWGGWLVVTAAVFSFSRGVIHTYYTVALAPAIAALVGGGASLLWRHRQQLWARGVAVLTTLLSAGWAYALLDRAPHWYPWLRYAIAAAGAVAASAVLLTALPRPHGRAGGGWKKGAGITALGAMAVACLLGPLAYTVQTVTTPHTGSVPSAGPATATAFTGAGTGGGSFGGGVPQRPGSSNTAGVGAGSPEGTSLEGGSLEGGAPHGSTPGRGLPAGLSGRSGDGTRIPAGGGGQFAGRAGAPSGSVSQVSKALVTALKTGASSYRWVAATDGSSSAATLELATGGDAVMAIGGFNGNGGNLSLATFESYVQKGEVHYYIAGQGGGGPGGGTGSTSAIATWVESHFQAKTVGGETVYDLTSPLAN